MRIFTVIGMIVVLWIVITAISQPSAPVRPPMTEAEILNARKEAEDRCPDPAKCREANRKAYADLAKREAAEKKAAGEKFVEQVYVAAAKKDITAAMRDPSSAIFGDVFFSRKKGEAVCGMVNAKNGFGGYTGMQPFVIMLPKGKVAIGDADAWNRHCAGFVH